MQGGKPIIKRAGESNNPNTSATAFVSLTENLIKDKLKKSPTHSVLYALKSPFSQEVIEDK